VHCPECDAIVSPEREFCPACGAPIRLGRRGRGPAGRGLGGSRPIERSEEELKGNRKRVLVIGAALLFALGIFGKLNFFPSHIDIGSHDRPRGPVVVEAQQLFQAYRDDPRAADRKYGHRNMVVTGEFVRIAPDDRGDPDLRLKTSDPEAPLGIDMIQAAFEQATTLRPGQIVTVSCARVDRTGEERWLRNCAIQSVSEARALPSSSPSTSPSASPSASPSESPSASPSPPSPPAPPPPPAKGNEG